MSGESLNQSLYIPTVLCSLISSLPGVSVYGGTLSPLPSVTKEGTDSDTFTGNTVVFPKDVMTGKSSIISVTKF